MCCLLFGAQTSQELWQQFAFDRSGGVCSWRPESWKGLTRSLAAVPVCSFSVCSRGASLRPCFSLSLFLSFVLSLSLSLTPLSLKLDGGTETSNTAIFTPASYEGNTCIPGFFHISALPSQYATAALDTMMRQLCSTLSCAVFLLGSGDAFDTNLFLIIRSEINKYNGNVAGEALLTSSNLAVVADSIASALPYGGIIIDSADSDTSASLRALMNTQGMTNQSFHFIFLDPELPEVGSADRQAMAGHYAVLSFLPDVATNTLEESLTREAASNFVAEYTAMFGMAPDTEAALVSCMCASVL